MAEFKTGQVPWNKDLKMSDESRAKMRSHVFSEEHRRHLSESHMGGPSSYTSWKKGNVPWNKGKHLSAKIRNKISSSNKGRYFRDGYVPSVETRKKIRLALLGEKSSAWRGGLATKPYTFGFTRELKTKIRARDGFTCLICGKGENGKAHVIHHIDYSKSNHAPSNLATLCTSCHSKTNHKREYWLIYFKKGDSYGK